MVNKKEVVNILTNFSKFEESQEELIRGTAKLEQMNWSNIFGTLLSPRLYINVACNNVNTNFSNTTRRLLRRSLRLPKRKWAQGQAGL